MFGPPVHVYDDAPLANILTESPAHITLWLLTAVTVNGLTITAAVNEAVHPYWSETFTGYNELLVGVTR